mmetsp:Transcript_9496/g.20236  ORF Transcript_9496/g.20236 Transcript_9496/m.20236 type:complete len:343 (-) Transcript_9496:632-1660(-)
MCACRFHCASSVPMHHLSRLNCQKRSKDRPGQDPRTSLQPPANIIPNKDVPTRTFCLFMVFTTLPAFCSRDPMQLAGKASELCYRIQLKALPESLQGVWCNLAGGMKAQPRSYINSRLQLPYFSTQRKRTSTTGSRHERISEAVPPLTQQAHLEDGHSNVEAVAGLPEVGGTRVRVHLHRDLVHPRQGVHDHRMLLQCVHDALVDDVLATSLCVVVQVGEPLLLDASLVQHVHIRRHLLQVVHLLPADASSSQHVLDVIPHLDHLWRHKVHLDVLVHGQQHAQRAHCAAVSQVSNHADLEVLKTSNFTLDGVHVQQGLSRMLAGAITSIDNGDASHISSTLC